MKICAYCTTQNRDEAIFCSRCRRPLRATPTRKEISARQALNWFLAVLVLMVLSAYLLSSRSFFAPVVMQTSTPLSTRNLLAEPQPTRTHEPITPSTCVKNTTIKIRRGPGTQYETIDGLVYGTCFTILGRDEDASWAYIVSKDHQTGWVAASLLGDVGDLTRVSVREHALGANPARPTLTTAEIAHGAQVYLTQVAATNLPESSLAHYKTPCFDMVNRIGRQVSCRLEKAHCDYLPALEGSPTFCNDRPYPDHTFTLIVPGEDWSEYDGQCIIVSGYLTVSRGALQIEAFDRSQVSSCS